MNKVTGIVIGVIVVFFIGFTAWSVGKKDESSIDLSKYDINTIIEGNDDNGGIADHVKGDENAQVVIFEYADYQCSGCASVNPWVNTLLSEYEGKVKLVYRSFLLSYHQNAHAAAAAAEAAGLQGYWQEYATLLFSNQAEWSSASVSERGTYFSQYFQEASDGAGDLEKFQTDLESTAVKAKVDFDVQIGTSLDIKATPALYIDGELIDWYDQTSKDGFLDYMRNIINAKLAK